MAAAGRRALLSRNELAGQSRDKRPGASAIRLTGDPVGRTGHGRNPRDLREDRGLTAILVNSSSGSPAIRDQIDGDGYGWTIPVGVSPFRKGSMTE
jgi:hypothetical protein